MKNIAVLIVVAFASCATSQKHQALTTSSLCVAQFIKAYSALPKQNPQRSIYNYIYKNKTVVYVTPICCGQFSDL